MLIQQSTFVFRIFKKITEVCYLCCRWFIIIIIIIIIITIIIISFMQGIYTYIREKNYVPREHTVAAILLLLFMVLISLVPMLNLLYFYISTFRSVCAVPSMAVVYSSWLHVFLVCCSRFFWMTLKCIIIIIIIIIIMLPGGDAQK